MIKSIIPFVEHRFLDIREGEELNKIKVLIADDSVEYTRMLSDFLKSSGEVEIVGIVGNGIDALSILKNTEVDILVLDVIMPILDGVSVVKSVNDLPKRPKILVISAMPPDSIMFEVMKLGAHFFMAKPVSFNSVLERIKTMFSEKLPNFIFPEVLEAADNADLETAVTEIMHSIGIPAHVKGYQYLRTAIMKVIADPSLIDAITKQLYPTIAKAYQTTPSRVERAVRHAIELAWDRGDIDVLNKFFGYTINHGKGKPTNSEFIAMISDKLRVEVLV